MRVYNQSHLKILFLPAKSKYPSETKPISGIFIKEQAKAASLYNEVVVLYAYPDPAPQPEGFYQISEDIEDGIRTIRAKYRGISPYLKRLVFRGGKAKQPLSSTISNKFTSTLKKPLSIPWIMAEALLYYGSILAAFRRLVKEGWRPDIIHAHFSLVGLPAIILGKLYKIPVVITEHRPDFSSQMRTFPERIKFRFAINRARMVVAVSNASKKNFETCGVKNEFQVVPNTVNTELFYPLTFQNRNERKRLLLVARFYPAKGIPYLLQALAQVKEKRQDFVLDIVGDGAERDKYEELTRSLELGEMVKFHGLKLKSEVAEFMRNCDFYVQSSLAESFGVAYIEAMACGKPVIASDVGGVRETVTNENAILVPPKDITALAEAIEDMLDSYTDYSPEKIAQYVKERFSYEVVGEMLDQIYRKVADRE